MRSFPLCIQLDKGKGSPSTRTMLLPHSQSARLAQLILSASLATPLPSLHVGIGFWASCFVDVPSIHWSQKRELMIPLPEPSLMHYDRGSCWELLRNHFTHYTRLFLKGTYRNHWLVIQIWNPKIALKIDFWTFKFVFIISFLFPILRLQCTYCNHCLEKKLCCGMKNKMKMKWIILYLQRQNWGQLGPLLHLTLLHLV